jgi:GNAT superfamily N-acetyltransferase
MEIRPAGLEDVVTYAALGRAAQAWLHSLGLQQYVPAAHEEYASAIRSKAEAGILYAVEADGKDIGFFAMDASPSPWWPADGIAAMYLAGMVVARSARGLGVGSLIINWCVAETARRGRPFLRLDCHADNPWLCRYYEAHGFELQGRVDQHPGYVGCLYQRTVLS